MSELKYTPIGITVDKSEAKEPLFSGPAPYPPDSLVLRSNFNRGLMMSSDPGGGFLSAWNTSTFFGRLFNQIRLFLLH